MKRPGSRTPWGNSSSRSPVAGTRRSSNERVPSLSVVPATVSTRAVACREPARQVSRRSNGSPARSSPSATSCSPAPGVTKVVTSSVYGIDRRASTVNPSPSFTVTSPPARVITGGPSSSTTCTSDAFSSPEYTRSEPSPRAATSATSSTGVRGR